MTGALREFHPIHLEAVPHQLGSNGGPHVLKFDCVWQGKSTSNHKKQHPLNTTGRDMT